MNRFMWLSPTLFVLATGCSQQMYGTWHTTRVDPADAAAQVGIQSIRLNSDGTYLAATKAEGGNKQSAGKWAYDGYNLRLTGNDGTQRVYQTVVWLGKYMDATAKMGDRTVTVKMEKQPDNQ